MTMRSFMPPDRQPERNFYWELEIDAEEYEAIVDWLDGKPPGRTLRERLHKALAKARRIEGPLLRAYIDWEKAESRAKARGESVADLIFDEGKAVDPS